MMDRMASETADDELVVRAKAGESIAFESLANRARCGCAPWLSSFRDASEVTPRSENDASGRAFGFALVPQQAMIRPCVFPCPSRSFWPLPCLSSCGG